MDTAAQRINGRIWEISRRAPRFFFTQSDNPECCTAYGHNAGCLREHLFNSSLLLELLESTEGPITSIQLKKICLKAAI